MRNGLDWTSVAVLLSAKFGPGSSALQLDSFTGHLPVVCHLSSVHRWRPWTLHPDLDRPSRLSALESRTECREISRSEGPGGHKQSVNELRGWTPTSSGKGRIRLEVCARPVSSAERGGSTVKKKRAVFSSLRLPDICTWCAGRRHKDAIRFVWLDRSAVCTPDRRLIGCIDSSPGVCEVPGTVPRRKSAVKSSRRASQSLLDRSLALRTCSYYLLFFHSELLEEDLNLKAFHCPGLQHGKES